MDLRWLLTVDLGMYRRRENVIDVGLEEVLVGEELGHRVAHPRHLVKGM